MAKAKKRGRPPMAKRGRPPKMAGAKRGRPAGTPNRKPSRPSGLPTSKMAPRRGRPAKALGVSRRGRKQKVKSSVSPIIESQLIVLQKSLNRTQGLFCIVNNAGQFHSSIAGWTPLGQALMPGGDDFAIDTFPSSEQAVAVAKSLDTETLVDPVERYFETTYSIPNGYNQVVSRIQVKGEHAAPSLFKMLVDAKSDALREFAAEHEALAAASEAAAYARERLNQFQTAFGF